MYLVGCCYSSMLQHITAVPKKHTAAVWFDAQVKANEIGERMLFWGGGLEHHRFNWP